MKILGPGGYRDHGKVVYLIPSLSVAWKHDDRSAGSFGIHFGIQTESRSVAEILNLAKRQRITILETGTANLRSK